MKNKGARAQNLLRCVSNRERCCSCDCSFLCEQQAAEEGPYTWCCYVPYTWCCYVPRRALNIVDSFHVWAVAKAMRSLCRGWFAHDVLTYMAVALLGWGGTPFVRWL